jgi:3-oxoacyl-[acyl-carrier-protein] synthase III
MQPKSIAIVGAAETTRLGVIPDTSQIQLHADAALNAMADAGLKPADIDGIATAGETPVTVAHYLGLTPKWVDGTAVGGCSFMIHVRHAAAAIASGLCETVLITHGESGRSGVGRTRNVVAPTSLALWADGAADFVHDPGAALHDAAVAPAKAGAQGRATRPRIPGFPLARERRNRQTSNWRWSRSRSANGRRRTRAPPSRRQRFPRLARALGDDLEVGRSRGIGLAAALFPILQRRQRDAVHTGEFLLGHP